MLKTGPFEGNSSFIDQKNALFERILNISTEPTLFSASDYTPFQLHIPSYTYGLIAGEKWYEPQIIVTTTFPDSSTSEESDEPIK